MSLLAKRNAMGLVSVCDRPNRCWCALERTYNRSWATAAIPLWVTGQNGPLPKWPRDETAPEKLKRPPVKFQSDTSSRDTARVVRTHVTRMAMYEVQI